MPSSLIGFFDALAASLPPNPDAVKENRSEIVRASAHGSGPDFHG